MSEILDVLRKHQIPVETVALNISLLDAAFDEVIPQLKTYKPGYLVRRVAIDNVPMALKAHRRYPFDEVVQTLEQTVKPRVEGFAETLRREYPDLRITFVNKRTTSAYSLYDYQISIECRFSDDVHEGGLDFAIWLQQKDATSYPRLRAYVAWLVDEESGGDWGLDTVRNEPLFGDYSPHKIGLLQRSLPALFDAMCDEIKQKLAEGQIPQDNC